LFNPASAEMYVMNDPSLVKFLLLWYLLPNEVGGACGTHGRGQKNVKGGKERDHLEDQGIGEKMGSEWILGRLAWGCELDLTGSGQGSVAGCGECRDEPSGSCATELVS
jgi:hypothetical protein